MMPNKQTSKPEFIGNISKMDKLLARLTKQKQRKGTKDNKYQ